jgi:hypothetical protein
VAWNQTVNEIAFAEDQFFTFKGVRAHAMMHILNGPRSGPRPCSRGMVGREPS